MILKTNSSWFGEVKIWSGSVSCSWSNNSFWSSPWSFPWSKWRSMYWSASWSDDGLGCLSDSTNSTNWRKDI